MTHMQLWNVPGRLKPLEQCDRHACSMLCRGQSTPLSMLIACNGHSLSGEACGVVGPLFVLVGVSDACRVLDGDGAAGAGLVDGDDVTLELSVRLTDDVGLAFALFEEGGLLVSVAVEGVKGVRDAMKDGIAPS